MVADIYLILLSYLEWGLWKILAGVTIATFMLNYFNAYIYAYILITLCIYIFSL